MADSILKWALLGVTAMWLSISFIHISPNGVSIRCRCSGLTQYQRLLSALYMVFLPLISHTTLSLGSFRLRVMKWHIDETNYNNNDSTRPEFDHDMWNQYGLSNFAIAFLILTTLYIAYSWLIGALRPAMEVAQRKVHEESNLYTAGSGRESREKPIKRVTFDLPDPDSRLVQLYSYLSQQLARHARRIVSFVSYALLVVYLLPKSLEHAFYFELARVQGVALTSDHVIVMFAVYFCVELVVHTFSMTRPAGFSEVRFMASRFTLCYGAFLVIASVLALLQFNDTLKLYLYRMYEPHAAFKDRPSSFYDSSIPNINVVSMVLENYMTKYSYSLISVDTSSAQKNAIIKSSLMLFSSVFGDCIACLLFATMVVMPGVLGLLV